MAFRWFVYDRQDKFFRFLDNINFFEQTKPKIIFEVKDFNRNRLEVHTARLMRFHVYGLYQFPSNTEFYPEFFKGYSSAWAWMISKGGKPQPTARIVSPCHDVRSVLHAPGIVEDTVRKIIIDPRTKKHWVRIKDINFPVEVDTPVKIFGKKHGRFSEEVLEGRFHPELSYRLNKPAAELPPFGTGRWIILREDDMVAYLWTRPGKTMINDSDPKEGEFFWGMEPDEAGHLGLVKKAVVPI